MVKHRNEVYEDDRGIFWARVNGKRKTPNTNRAAWNLYHEMTEDAEREADKGHTNGLEVLILRGLPGSGKTTWAKQLMAEKSWYHRVCKDDLRAMLHNGVYNTYHEKAVRELQNVLIRELLWEFGPVIVDNTNLNDRQVRTMLNYCFSRLHTAVPVWIIDFLTPVEVCIERDAQRPSPVGADRIRAMADEFENARAYRPGITPEQWHAEQAAIWQRIHDEAEART
jgi:predicted kinase